MICCTSHTQMPFTCLVTNCLPNEAVGGRNGQCFGFYTYTEDGMSRSENVTDGMLQRFMSHYKDERISKWDIFNYVYGDFITRGTEPISLRISNARSRECRLPTTSERLRRSVENWRICI